MKLKKIGALLLAVTLIAAVCAALADTTLNGNGEQGAFTSPDTPISQADKILVLSKEIVAYNLDETTINAPTISYKYTIGAATVPSGATVTDAAGKHTAGQPVTAPVKAGVGSPVIANSGVVAWTPAETMKAKTGGDSNKKDISIDFSSVVFGGAGVYRYAITEELTSGTYAASGVTETKVGSAAGSHVRYIDVYVRPATTGFSNGSTADEWDIYGFTCFYNNNAEITDANKTTGAVKTTGFVEGTTDGTTKVTADSYYTFNLTVSKTVENDAYAAAQIAFPFTVILTNSAVTNEVDIIGKVESGTVTGWTNPAKAALSADTTRGIASIKSGGQVKYVGIPNGTGVEVYETNTAAGTVYKVTTVLTTSSTATTTDAAVEPGSAPSQAAPQAATKPAYQSTKATFTTTADADDDNDYTVAVTNTLVTISPTGLVVRFAPYALLFIGGVALMIIARKHRKHSEEDE